MAFSRWTFAWQPPAASRTMRQSAQLVVANLPDQGCEAGWQLQAEFPLGIREAIPAPMDPEPVIRGIKSNGYFVWRERPVHNPSGSSVAPR
jgi:hypothetical protein